MIQMRQGVLDRWSGFWSMNDSQPDAESNVGSRFAAQSEPTLKDLDGTLRNILEAIFQANSRRANIATGAALKTAGGAAAVGGITGLVGTFGTAGTGTAIASLSGAAANSATLAAIGGVIGGGMAAGSLILATGVIGAGIAAGVYGRRLILGRPRSFDDLEDFEARIILSITAFRQGLRRDGTDLPALGDQERKAVRKVFLESLIGQLSRHFRPDSSESFHGTLTTRHRRRLARSLRELRIIADYWT